MNEIKIPSIEFVRLKKGMTDSELNDYIAENDDYSFLVYLRYKYDFEEEWLKKPYQKPTFKLTQFEYDLLQLYKGKYSFKLSNSLRGMKEKGYFRSVDENAKIEDILESCEVIK